MVNSPKFMIKPNVTGREATTVHDETYHTKRDQLFTFLNSK